MSRIFLLIYDFFSTRKILLLTGTLTIFFISLFYSSKIRLEEDITQFIPDNEEMKTSNAVFRNIRIKDRLIVHLRLTDSTAVRPDLLITYCDSMTRMLSPLLPEYVEEIMSRTPEDMMEEMYDLIREHLPVFLTDEDFLKIDSLLTPGAINQRLKGNYNTLMSPGGFALRRYIADDPLGINMMALAHLQKIKPNDRFDNYRQHFLTSDHRHLLFFLIPVNSGTESSKNAHIIDLLDESIHQLSSSFPGITAEYFGGPAVSVCNARQIKQDTMISLNIALVVIIIFLIISFRSKRAPVLILLPVIFGASVALMVLYFIKGTVSAITIGAGSVIIGIALNYSIHVMSHLRHDTPRGIVSGLASPLTLGSFTTIGAFLGLTFAKSRALADFGLFAAFSLIASALFCLIVLPHILPKPRTERKDHVLFKQIERFASWQPEKNKVALIIILIITVISILFTGKTSFDSDMMKLNYMDKKLKQAEHNLTLITEDPMVQTIYVVSTGASLDEAERNNLRNIKHIEQMQQDGIISQYSSADLFLVPQSEQVRRISRWNDFWTESKKSRLEQNLFGIGAVYNFRELAFHPFLEQLGHTFIPLNTEDNQFLKENILSEWLTQTDQISMIMTQLHVSKEQKAHIYSKLEKLDNLVIFDKSYFASKFVHIISDDFYLILFISSFIVFFTLWITYGRIELTLMTFAPMALSWIWITGIMGAFGIGFNIVNIIVSTFIFGLGDDYSIFITDGLSDGYKTGRKTLPAHKTAILLSAFAMIVGTGVLIFAKHPALTSIALVSTIGMVSVVIAAYTVQPFLYRFFISGRTRKGKYPFTLFSLLSSIYVFLIFGAGSMLLSLFSLLLKIIPFGKKQKKYCLHWLISKLCKLTLYSFPLIKKRYINQSGEDFRNPSVIISNHQSFLDILIILSLYPKIVMLTNSWVWNSPFFGLLVRNAGFYNVNNGYEGSAGYLKSMVADGYSIAVFPEGSRSADGKIRRFHNGAFYLADQLGLDILPVVLYGTGTLMPKTDPFNMRRGWLIAGIQQRIKHDSLKNNTLRTTAQQMSSLVKSCYEEMLMKYDTPENPYFRQHLITNYLYKGPVLEWYLRVKLKMENNYQLFNNIVPKEAAITDIGCGYGFLAYMLTFLSSGRKVTGIDYDDEKITVANHCFSKDDRLQFIQTDAGNYSLLPSDVFIMNDMLHYLIPEKQQALLNQCAQKLNPDGCIVIRDANKDMDQAHRLTRLTEFFSTRLFRFNKTANRLYFMSEKKIEEFASLNRLIIHKMNNDKHTSNMIYILRKNNDIQMSIDPDME